MSIGNESKEVLHDLKVCHMTCSLYPILLLEVIFGTNDKFTMVFSDPGYVPSKSSPS